MSKNKQKSPETMQVVYVIYSDDGICGVFSTREKAEDWIRNNPHVYSRDAAIVEEEVL